MPHPVAHDEWALRVLLHAVGRHATAAGRTMKPLLSVHFGFCVRILVQLDAASATTAAAIATSTCIAAATYMRECNSCGCQLLFGSRAAAQQPPCPGGCTPAATDTATATASDTGAATAAQQTAPQTAPCAGPIWSQQLHDRNFVATLLDTLSALSGASPTTDARCRPRVGYRSRKLLRSLLSAIQAEAALGALPLYVSFRTELVAALRRNPAALPPKEVASRARSMLARARAALTEALPATTCGGYHANRDALKVAAKPQTLALVRGQLDSVVTKLLGAGRGTKRIALSDATHKAQQTLEVAIAAIFSPPTAAAASSTSTATCTLPPRMRALCTQLVQSAQPTQPQQSCVWLVSRTGASGGSDIKVAPTLHAALNAAGVGDIVVLQHSCEVPALHVPDGVVLLGWSHHQHQHQHHHSLQASTARQLVDALRQRVATGAAAVTEAARHSGALDITCAVTAPKAAPSFGPVVTVASTGCVTLGRAAMLARVQVREVPATRKRGANHGSADASENLHVVAVNQRDAAAALVDVTVTAQHRTAIGVFSGGTAVLAGCYIGCMAQRRSSSSSRASSHPPNGLFVGALGAVLVTRTCIKGVTGTAIHARDGACVAAWHCNVVHPGRAGLVGQQGAHVWAAATNIQGSGWAAVEVRAAIATLSCLQISASRKGGILVRQSYRWVYLKHTQC